LPETRVRKLRDDEFYSQFLDAAKGARSVVNIMYLATYPPDDVPTDERQFYYSALLQLIKKRPQVRFRRIVRTSAKNRSWVTEMISLLREVPNADVAILKESEREPMPLALSVQVIDGEKTWLVAVGSHERVADYRDLYIENRDVAATMQQYYDRLWGKATKLLDSGRITSEGHTFMTEGAR
jgi:hypothetical protein